MEERKNETFDVESITHRIGFCQGRLTSGDIIDKDFMYDLYDLSYQYLKYFEPILKENNKVLNDNYSLINGEHFKKICDNVNSFSDRVDFVIEKGKPLEVSSIITFDAKNNIKNYILMEYEIQELKTKMDKLKSKKDKYNKLLEQTKNCNNVLEIEINGKNKIYVDLSTKIRNNEQQVLDKNIKIDTNQQNSCASNSFLSSEQNNIKTSLVIITDKDENVLKERKFKRFSTSIEVIVQPKKLALSSLFSKNTELKFSINECMLDHLQNSKVFLILFDKYSNIKIKELDELDMLLPHVLELYLISNKENINKIETFRKKFTNLKIIKKIITDSENAFDYINGELSIVSLQNSSREHAIARAQNTLNNLNQAEIEANKKIFELQKNSDLQERKRVSDEIEELNKQLSKNKDEIKDIEQTLNDIETESKKIDADRNEKEKCLSDLEKKVQELKEEEEKFLSKIKNTNVYELHLYDSLKELKILLTELQSRNKKIMELLREISLCPTSFDAESLKKEIIYAKNIIKKEVK